MALVDGCSLVAQGCDSGLNGAQQFYVDQQPLMSSHPEALFVGIATVVVPNETYRGIAATNLPSMIASDFNGVIYLLHNAYRPVRDLDRIVRNSFAARWPNCFPRKQCSSSSR